jgi:hypothetical protein
MLQKVLAPFEDLAVEIEQFNDPQGVYARMPLEIEL